MALLIVSLIASAIGGILFVGLRGKLDSDSQRGRTVARLTLFREALEDYDESFGNFPAESEGLTALMRGGEPIIKGIGVGPEDLVDGWNKPFVYRVGESGLPTLYSVGPNGVDEAGSGDDLVARASDGEKQAR
jgi:hypothetical protein